MSGLERVRRGKWRGLVGLIAAYALALQAILGLVSLSQANPNDGLQGSDALFVLCSHDASADAGAADGAPGKADVHCPLCTLAACTTALAPDPSSLPVQGAAKAEPAAFAELAATPSFLSPRAGLSRAPPTAV
jgi:hypothetical protein